MVVFAYCSMIAQSAEVTTNNRTNIYKKEKKRKERAKRTFKHLQIKRSKHLQVERVSRKKDIRA